MGVFFFHLAKIKIAESKIHFYIEPLGRRIKGSTELSRTMNNAERTEAAEAILCLQMEDLSIAYYSVYHPHYSCCLPEIRLTPATHQQKSLTKPLVIPSPIV